MITEAERSATDRKRRLEKYFVRTPDSSEKTTAVIFLAAAGLAALIGLILLASSPFFGVVFLAVAAYLGFKGYGRYHAYQEAYNKAEPKPSGRELDEYLAQDLAEIEERSLRELGLTAEDLETDHQEWDPVKALGNGQGPKRLEKKRPILVYGPAPFSGFAVGDDKIWRFRRYEVMVICPTHHHLALFRAELDMLTGGLYHQETQEYQYTHVVSVSTVTLPPSNQALKEADEGAGGNAKKKGTAKKDDDGQVRFARTVLKQFELGVSSGRSSQVTIGISDANNPANEAHMHDSGIQQIISSVRRVLRDKKGAFG